MASRTSSTSCRNYNRSSSPSSRSIVLSAMLRGALSYLAIPTGSRNPRLSQVQRHSTRRVAEILPTLNTLNTHTSIDTHLRAYTEDSFEAGSPNIGLTTGENVSELVESEKIEERIPNRSNAEKVSCYGRLYTVVPLTTVGIARTKDDHDDATRRKCRTLRDARRVTRASSLIPIVLWRI